MPYIMDKGFVLSPEQEEIRQILIETAKKFRHSYDAKALPNLKVSDEGHLMGVLVQPAYTEGGPKWPISVVEKRFPVYYVPNYGVTANRLCTSNGSAWEIASCVRDNTRWEPNAG